MSGQLDISPEAKKLFSRSLASYFPGEAQERIAEKIRKWGMPRAINIRVSFREHPQYFDPVESEWNYDVTKDEETLS